jgi:CheY-specific phosphatase CheX
VRLSDASARKLAAGFLGEDEGMLTDSQPGQAVCELANMLCGSLLSKLESDESFDLAPPALVPAGREDSVGLEILPVARQSFALEEGILTVSVRLGRVA